MSEKIGVIGSGEVGEALADGFLKHGYTVMRGSRDPGKLNAWKAKTGGNASTGTMNDTARFADTLVLAVKGSGAESAIKECGVANLAGKTVLDTTNPIADAPPDNGVLRYFTNMNESLMERLQRAAPGAHFVKCFSIVGSSLMVNPDFGATKPTMFICGNSPQAKTKTGHILNQFGWEIADMGGVEAARAIEPLAILWCIPGFLHNNWRHAYKDLTQG